MNVNLFRNLDIPEGLYTRESCSLFEDYSTRESWDIFEDSGICNLEHIRVGYMELIRHSPAIFNNISLGGTFIVYAYSIFNSDTYINIHDSAAIGIIEQSRAIQNTNLETFVGVDDTRWSFNTVYNNGLLNKPSFVEIVGNYDYKDASSNAEFKSNIQNYLDKPFCFTDTNAYWLHKNKSAEFRYVMIASHITDQDINMLKLYGLSSISVKQVDCARVYNSIRYIKAAQEYFK